jgi:polysaccharide export outer membrane protein
LTDSIFRALGLLALCWGLVACATEQTLPPAGTASHSVTFAESTDYRIGPGDTLNIQVWHNSDFSGSVPVRPDGKISLPLLGDIAAAGKEPNALADDIKEKLKPYVKDPLVTVTPTNFVGPVGREIRVIGEAAQPRAIPFSTDMTLLDVMIAVGGLTKYADGNRAVVIRRENGSQKTYHVHLDSLIRDGEVNQNVSMEPGDILIIPQRFF